MTIEFQEATLALAGSTQDVEFTGAVAKAHVVLRAFDNISTSAGTMVRPRIDRIFQNTVTVSLPAAEPSTFSVSVLVIAEITTIEVLPLPESLEITVAWNDGDLKVKPCNPTIHALTKITWKPCPADPCDIVGVLGLFGQSGFGEVIGREEPDSSRLEWSCLNTIPKKKQTISYSLLAVKKLAAGQPLQVAYKDPKITNDPMSPVHPMDGEK